jgi:phosphatidylinositol alpha 1,6-mannosyltransferase
MGLAIVAGRVGGFVDLVKPGENGFLYDPMDEQGMRQGLVALLGDPARLLEMRLASRRLSVHFDLDVIVDGYEAVFTDILANHPTPGWKA